MDAYNNNSNRSNDDLDTTELRARGNWNEMKGKMRQQYADLTDDDFEYAEGKQEEWYGKLSKKLGRTVDDVRDWLRKL
ncbi:MAG: CsbD family protein [Ferruginibacter sp.]|nr:CsbD family protein [Cytophagales bacterium]